MSFFDINISQNIVVNGLIERAEQIILSEHGEQGKTPLSYHGHQHFIDTLEATKKISDKALERGLISTEEADLLFLAAAFHDTVQGKGSGENEKQSARVAMEHMEKSGIFSPHDMARVKDAILSTQIHIDKDKFGQSVNNNHGIFDMIMADSDLASLGSIWEIYYDRMKAFQDELFGKNPSKKKIAEYLERQVILLSRHKYYTEIARELYPYQDKNLDNIRDM